MGEQLSTNTYIAEPSGNKIFSTEKFKMQILLTQFGATMSKPHTSVFNAISHNNKLYIIYYILSVIRRSIYP